jgi:hypothetical protein
LLRYGEPEPPLPVTADGVGEYGVPIVFDGPERMGGKASGEAQDALAPGRINGKPAARCRSSPPQAYARGPQTPITRSRVSCALLTGPPQVAGSVIWQRKPVWHVASAPPDYSMTRVFDDVQGAQRADRRPGRAGIPGDRGVPRRPAVMARRPSVIPEPPTSILRPQRPPGMKCSAIAAGWDQLGT